MADLHPGQMGGQGFACAPGLAPGAVRYRRLLVLRLDTLAAERLGLVEQLALARGLLGTDPKEALAREAKLLEQMLDLAHLGCDAVRLSGQTLIQLSNSLVLGERLGRQLGDHSLEFLVLFLQGFGAAHRARIIL